MRSEVSWRGSRVDFQSSPAPGGPIHIPLLLGLSFLICETGLPGAPSLMSFL